MGSVAGVTCFLSLPLLPQYWRACPSQPALLNAAHGSSVKPTSVTTPTASPSPLMPRLSRCLSYASWPHCACSMICHLSPTQTQPHHYNYCELTWAVIGCLCSTSDDSYQASDDRSQPNLFAWHRSPWKKKKKLYSVSTYLVCEKYVDTLTVQSAMTVIQLSSETSMHDTCKRLCIIMAYFF